MPASPEVPSDVKRGKAELNSFIQDEKTRLESLLALWEKVSGGEAQEEELLPLLRDCDYLYYHFPDRDTLPSTKYAFLFRVIGEARDLLRKMEL